jgi:hypothetical protein
VDRLIELTMRVARVQYVRSFGSLVISLPRLRADGIPAERNLVRFDDFSLVKKLKSALFLENHNSVSAKRASAKFKLQNSSTPTPARTEILTREL